MPALHLKTLRRIRNWLRQDESFSATAQHFADEIDRALAPRRWVSARKKAKTAARQSKNVETADLRELVFARAGGKCECECGCGNEPREMDHFWGRSKASQAPENCWAFCTRCHADKTANEPSSLTWLEKFRAHCIRHSYWAEAAKAGRRLQYLEAKAKLSKATRGTP